MRQHEQDLAKTANVQGKAPVPSRDAGRALDALVAEKVMGFRWRRPIQPLLIGYVHYAALLPLDAPADGRITTTPDDEALTACVRVIDAVPCYSTNISAAWLVVEKLREMGWANISVSNFHAPEWGCTLWREPDSDYDEWADAPTAPLAICRAALQAVEVPA